MSTTLDFLIKEPAEQYHARSREFLSSHQLAAFRKSPALYHRKKLGLIEDEDRPAYLLGRAVHAWALEGREAFDSAFARGGPINPKTGRPFGTATQAYQEWAAAQGKPVLTDEQHALVSNIVAGISAHDGARELLAHGTPEGVARTSYCDVPCQIRLDWLNPDAGIVDLKTCDDLTWFEADARRYGYAHQLAFYRAVLALVTGHTFPVHLIAVEKREPFRCGVWLLDDQALSVAQHENEAAMERLKQCVARDEWPTGYEERRVLDCI